MDALDEFLNRKGAIETLCEIGRHGARYKELDGELEVSHQTMLNRVREAGELSLVDAESIETDYGIGHKYILTKRGIVVLAMFEMTGAVNAYFVQKDRRREFFENVEEARDLITEKFDEMEEGEEFEAMPDMVPMEVVEIDSETPEEDEDK